MNSVDMILIRRVDRWLILSRDCVSSLGIDMEPGLTDASDVGRRSGSVDGDKAGCWPEGDGSLSALPGS